MFRLTIRELTAHKARLAATAVAVLLGVAFMTGTFVFDATLRRATTSIVAEANSGVDAVVRAPEAMELSYGETGTRIDASVLDAVEAVPGVQAAAPQITGYARLVGVDGDVVAGEGLMPPLGLNWVESPRLSAYRIVAGRAPLAADEVVVDPASARAAGYRPGDGATVVTREGQSHVTVVGLATFGRQNSPGDAPVVLFEESAAERLLSTPGRIDGVVVAAADGVDQAALVTALGGVLPDGVTAVDGAGFLAEARRSLEQSLAPFTAFLMSFALVSVLVAAFIINNTFAITVAQRAQRMAMLRALGAGRSQVVGAAMLEAVAVGVLASVAGVAAGIGVAVGLAALLGAFGMDLPTGPMAVEAADVVVAFVTGVTVTLVSAWRPAWRAGRVAPMAAINGVDLDASATSGRGRLLGRAVAVVGASVKPAGISGELAARNARRNQRRTVRTAGALAVGVALVVFMLVVSTSVKASFGGSTADSYRGTHVLDGGFEDGGGVSPRLAEELRSRPGVSAVLEARMARAEVSGSETDLFAFTGSTVAQLFDVGTVQGDLTQLGTDGIAVAADVAAAANLHLGSTVRVGTTGGSGEFVVRATYDGSTEWLGDRFVDVAAFDRLLPGGLDHRLYVIGEDPVVRAAARTFPGVEVLDRDGFVERASGKIDQALAVVFALLALGILISFLGISNTVALSVRERSRELGLMRAVGMSRRQVAATIRWESVVIALLGTAAGTSFGAALGWVAVRALRGEGIDTYAVPMGSLAIVAVGGAVVAWLAAALPARRGARADVLAAVAAR